MATFTFQIKRLGKKYTHEQADEIEVQANSLAQARTGAEAKYRRRHHLAAQVALSTILSESKQDDDLFNGMTVGQFRALTGNFWRSELLGLQSTPGRRFRLVRDLCFGGVPTGVEDPILGHYVSEEVELTVQQLAEFVGQGLSEVPATVGQTQFDQLVRLWSDDEVLGPLVPTAEYRYAIEVWDGSSWTVHQTLVPLRTDYPLGHVKNPASVKA